MSSPERPRTTASRRERYERVPKEEESQPESETSPSAVVVENLRLDDADSHSSGSFHDDETNSLVSPSSDGVFRKSTWTDSSDVDDEDRNTGESTSKSALHLMLSRSRDTNSVVSGIGVDSDWEDDDEAGIRRYHLDFEVRSDIPLPSEFRHDSVPKRIWQSFLELRTAARQRRAARLLTMPSQSWRYQAHACLITSCCDATDLGIILAAVGLTVWLFVGLAAGMGTSWWLMGFILFFLRVSARRLFEFFQAKRRKRRQRLSSADMELGGHAVGFRDAVKDSDHKSMDGHDVV